MSRPDLGLPSRRLSAHRHPAPSRASLPCADMSTPCAHTLCSHRANRPHTLAIPLHKRSIVRTQLTDICAAIEAALPVTLPLVAVLSSARVCKKVRTLPLVAVSSSARTSARMKVDDLDAPPLVVLRFADIILRRRCEGQRPVRPSTHGAFSCACACGIGQGLAGVWLAIGRWWWRDAGRSRCR